MLNKYLELKQQELYEVLSLVAENTLNDPSTNFQIVKSPFLGIRNCFKSTKYAYLVFTIFLNFMVCFITAGLVYFYLLFPFTFFIYSIFLGPLGLVFSLVHGVALSNIVACHETRLSSQYFMNMVYSLSSTRTKGANPIELYTGPPKESNIEPVPRLISIVENLMRWVFVLSKLVLWYAISLVPVFGVILLKIQSSAPRGFSYFKPYYKFSGKLNNDQLNNLYYSHYGQWILFGLITGLLESVPIVSGITICTNTCGCAMWELQKKV